MSLKQELLSHAKDPSAPLIIEGDRILSLHDIVEAKPMDNDLHSGDVAALVGDFDARTIATLIDLLDRGVTVMPLTVASQHEHNYFFAAGHATALISDGICRQLEVPGGDHPLLKKLASAGHAGMILFTSGTTGRPKAILHDFQNLISRFANKRSAYRTLNFLLFDHIGGLNTLFHTVYSGGLIVRTAERTPEAVCEIIERHQIELLPTTPTFLRMLALSDSLKNANLASLKLITYGTERMDEGTLKYLAHSLPEVDFRQTYGMSELGILRVKNRKRDELWIQVGGEGVESQIVDNELLLRSDSSMLGYLNADSPFDENGWYHTKDLVETDGDWLRFIGRKDDIINVGGLKVYPSEVEKVALAYPGIKFARAKAGKNPLTGMHVELECEPVEASLVNKVALLRFLKSRLPSHAVPKRISFGQIALNHRWKQL